MKLLSILPIARNISREMLTYFSAEEIPLGTIVSVPIRKKRFPGIIIESKDALQAKAEIKEMPFAIKKIIRHKDDTALPEWFMRTAQNIALDSASSIGAVLAALVPRTALEAPEIFFKKTEQEKKAASLAGGFDTLAIQSANAERYDMMRSIIRESFAKKKSVAIICPTEEDVAYFSTLRSEEHTSELQS